MVAASSLAERKLVHVGRSPVQLCAADDGQAVLALAAGGTSVAILDGRSATLRATIDVGVPAWNGIARGPLAYLACGDVVNVIDAVAGRVEASIPLASGSGSQLLVAAFERERIYALNTGATTVGVIDSATNTIIKSINVGDGPQYAQRANGLLFVMNGRSNDLVVVDESTLDVRRRVAVGRAPERCVFDADRSEIWTNNMTDGTLSAINLSSGEVVATIAVGPEPIRLTPWDSRGQGEWGVLCRSSAVAPHGTITFVDGATHAVIESLVLPGRALNWNWGIGPRHAVVYVTLADPPQMAIVDAATAQLVDTVALSTQPEPAGLGPGVVVSKSGGVFIACQNAVAFLTLE